MQETRWTQLSGALNEVCDLVLSRKVASAGAIEDRWSGTTWCTLHRARPSPASYRRVALSAVSRAYSDDKVIRKGANIVFQDIDQHYTSKKNTDSTDKLMLGAFHRSALPIHLDSPS